MMHTHVNLLCVFLPFTMLSGWLFLGVLGFDDSPALVGARIFPTFLDGDLRRCFIFASSFHSCTCRSRILNSLRVPRREQMHQHLLNCNC
jgi:hypothetical protein